MPVQQAVAERWVKLTGQYLLEGYGLTECSPLVSVNPHDIDYHSGSIGLPVPSTEAKLVDDDDNEVAPGQPGELCIKGPQVMLGYWQRPDATDEIIKDGWLHTGDIAVMDEEGFLRIVDRKKDMIPCRVLMSIRTKSKMWSCSIAGCWKWRPSACRPAAAAKR